MARISTPIDVPNLVLQQQHGLWQSAYHLIHPAGSDMPTGDQEDDNLQIWPFPHENPWWNPAQGVVERQAQSTDITDDEANDIGRRIQAGLSYWDEGCCEDLGCWYECQPGFECPDIPEEGKPMGDNGEERCYIPSKITSRVVCSTFGFEAADYWGRAERKLRKGRGRAIEQRLSDGDCVNDEDGNPVNPFLSDGSFTILADGDPQPVGAALKLLNCELAECGCDAAGMIHAPAPVVDCWSCNDCLQNSIVDYGDGMGWRNILRTKTRGNIVVSGSGYSGLGPNGEEPGPNQAWVYATPMVYLMWDTIQFFPEQGQFDNATSTKNNLVDVVAEQTVGAFYGSCCNAAVLVDLCETC